MTKQLTDEEAQQLRNAMALIESTTIALRNSPGKESEDAHFAACRDMAKLMPRIPHYCRTQDNKICELVGLVLGLLPDMPDAMAAIATQGLLEICPAEYEGMKQAIAMYGGKVQGNA